MQISLLYLLTKVNVMFSVHVARIFKLIVVVQLLWNIVFFSSQEHILMRNQNLVGLKLPELSEAAEQEKGAVS